MIDFVLGRALIDAAQRKRVKYEAKCAEIGYEFLPFSFSSFWELEKDAVTLLKRIRKFSMTNIGARPVTTEEKVQKKNDVKARILLNVSDDHVYAFLANQPNGSQLVHEDLEQIHEDNLEEIDLKWQLALLSMRARRGNNFARECKDPRNQESRARNQDSSRRTVNVEDISSKEMVAINGVGFDWSYMADEEVPTNLALMAFSDSEVHNTCSNTCLKSFETLKTQLDNLRVELNKSEFNLATYKRGLASVEEQLVFYKKNKVMLCDQIAVLKKSASFKDSEINGS
ncbi:hypothetical protein Tco_0296567 [Tanacetum coccineum]